MLGINPQEFKSTFSPQKMQRLEMYLLSYSYVQHDLVFIAINFKVIILLPEEASSLLLETLTLDIPGARKSELLS